MRAPSVPGSRRWQASEASTWLWTWHVPLPTPARTLHSTPLPLQRAPLPLSSGWPQVGGNLLEASVRSLNWNGRAIVVGFAGGSIPSIPANILLVKNVCVSGVFWGAHMIHEPRVLLSSAEQLVKWWLAGEIKPHIAARVPLSTPNEAFRLIESRESTGKVVLVP